MVETIGSIISLLALLYLFIKQSVPSQHKGRPSPPPPGYQDEEQDEEKMNDPFKEFLKAMEKEATAREAVQHMPPPPPKKKERPKQAPPRPSENYRLASSVEEHHLKSSLEKRHVKSRFNHHEELPGRALGLSLSHLSERSEKPRESRLKSTVRRLARRQDILIYQEIMGKPKSLRSEDFPV